MNINESSNQDNDKYDGKLLLSESMHLAVTLAIYKALDEANVPQQIRAIVHHKAFGFILHHYEKHHEIPKLALAGIKINGESVLTKHPYDKVTTVQDN